MSNSDNSLPPSGPALREAFKALIVTLHERRIRYAIIGGIATIQHSRVRTTDDIDSLLVVPQVEMPALFESLQGRGFEIDLLKNIRELRDDGLTTVHFKGVMIDLMRPVLPAYAHVLDSAIDAEIFGQTVKVSSAEGLLITKLIAMRPQDQADIQDILAANPDGLDLDYVRRELSTFTQNDDPRRAQFEAWVNESKRST